MSGPDKQELIRTNAEAHVTRKGKKRTVELLEVDLGFTIRPFSVGPHYLLEYTTSSNLYHAQSVYVSCGYIMCLCV